MSSPSCSKTSVPERPRFDPQAILGRVLAQQQVAHVMAVLDVYGRAAGGLLSNGLAFSALFAAIPTTLLVLGLTGIIVSDQTVRIRVSLALVRAFPPLTELIESALDALTRGAGLTSLVATVGVIWTVSQFYGAVDVAFARIFSDTPERDIVRRTARGFIVVALIGALIVAFIVVAGVASALDALAAEQVPLAGFLAGLLGSVWFIVGLAILTVLIAYRLLPPKAPRWRSAAIPAVVVGLAVVALSQVFMFLVPRLVGVAALAGSIASAFIALAWLSFTFQAVLYGAAWVRVRDRGVADVRRSDLGGPAAPAEPGVGRE
jgi:YihY family inner membrane protein